MKTSPLQLEKSFFTKVAIHANRDGNPDAKWEVEATPQFVNKPDDKRTWAVSLVVNIKPVGDSKPSYNAEVEIAGSFKVAENWPETSIEQLVHVNACSVLYSAAREMICNVTTRGPWPMLFLPTVSFAGPSPKTAPNPNAKPPDQKP